MMTMPSMQQTTNSMSIMMPKRTELNSRKPRSRIEVALCVVAFAAAGAGVARVSVVGRCVLVVGIINLCLEPMGRIFFVFDRAAHVPPTHHAGLQGKWCSQTCDSAHSFNHTLALALESVL